MTNREKADAYFMRLEGATLQEIADKFGVSRQCIHKIMPRTQGQKTCRANIIYPAIRAWMKENQYSNEAFARKIGYTGTAICSCFSGKSLPNKGLIDAILSATGLTYEVAFSTAPLEKE